MEKLAQILKALQQALSVEQDEKTKLQFQLAYRQINRLVKANTPIKKYSISLEEAQQAAKLIILQIKDVVETNKENNLVIPRELQQATTALGTILNMDDEEDNNDNGEDSASKLDS